MLVSKDSFDGYVERQSNVITGVNARLDVTETAVADLPRMCTELRMSICGSVKRMNLVRLSERNWKAG